MRIQCPFCGERDLSEFVYHGDANADRPDPDAADAAERFFEAVYLRDNPAGPHRRALVSRLRLPQLAARASQYAHARDSRRRVRQTGTARSDARIMNDSRNAASPNRLATPGLIDRSQVACPSSSTAGATRASAATRWPRRCSRRACGSSVDPSSTTVRAASSLPDPRSRTRSSSCAAARGASRTRARPSPSCSRGSRRAARTAGPRSPSMSARSIRCSRPIFVAGFYYKTFMWPAAFWEKLYEPLIRRAAGLGRASHEADPDTLREGPRILRCAHHRRRARPVSPPRSPPDAPVRASSSATRIFCSAAASTTSAMKSTT